MRILVVLDVDEETGDYRIIDSTKLNAKGIYYCRIQNYCNNDMWNKMLVSKIHDKIGFIAWEHINTVQFGDDKIKFAKEGEHRVEDL